MLKTSYLFEKIGANIGHIHAENVKNAFLPKSSGCQWVNGTDTFDALVQSFLRSLYVGHNTQSSALRRNSDKIT